MEEKKKMSLVERWLYRVEVVGNKLPDPVTLFLIIIGIILIASYVLAGMGFSVVNPATNETIKAVNLLSMESLQKMLIGVVGNFQGFPPLGLVLVTMIGVGVAERTGLMEAAMKYSIAKIPPAYVTLLIVFIGVNSNMAADAGFIVLPPLAASIYMALGRNPLAGLFTAYAAVAGAFHANIIVNMTDVLETSFTIPAAQLVMPSYVSSPAMNFYFIAVSMVILVIAAYFISTKIIEPRLGNFAASDDFLKEHAVAATDDPAVVKKELKGLLWAGISVVIFIAVLVALSIGPDAFLRDPKTGSLLSSKAPLMAGLVPIVLTAFLIPGIIYGLITGSIRSDRDVVKMMTETMSGMGGYIVLAFVAAQFLAYFKWSNMGLIIAIEGANTLKESGFVGIGLVIAFIILAGFINLFIGSASAKWAIMAPVFVPMLLLLGYDPALTQMAYRIGDSITNPISPLFPYFPICIAFAQRYMPKVGMGTVIANMLPFSIVFGILWTILLVIFIVMNLPLGPDGFIYLGTH
ncbi:AbgT family transporter [Veillonella magna]|uniref:AbgT family transporter n=1 Tax=Veillonella magna TaxID=464322 RepID=UPI0023F0CF0D|nr:AbgT family transporter [Veillonella magna]